MCVVVKKKAKKLKEVIAWKLFADHYLEYKGWYGLVYDRNGDDSYKSKVVKPYKEGRIYVSKRGPGFQAFVSKEDAIASQGDWLSKPLLKQVKLYGAKLGVINAMSYHANDKPGYTAKRMKLLP